MSDSVHEQISALMDGEMSEAERELLLRRMVADPDLRATWERYHLIRDALHYELPDHADPGLAGRVMAVIEDEPALQAARSPLPMRRLLKPIAGAAVAASVAALAIIGVRQFGGETPPAAVPTVAVRDTGYVQAAGTRWDLREQEIEARLNGYLVNHNEYTAANSLQGMLHYTRIAGYDAQQ
ncbi:MAG: sigma-E factor negative regulatory protein [Gammaproteobacteria bacterium]|nr:sigma-E factor negative regulatory protein [Gammaproteobacteria bacterium]NIR32879.1 sigma-E factor negative regulatory protein [Gammaproteobacteria bacterium]NIR99425.1 sigma-E factor negative regulatory protein [Gammaproteobacteria bacterium]NIT65039.1 sigma-E factor negative regulatory protein [Gammaproteobacteria bacterium]NIV21954.1 hypothetical protein [Gammaproteobacteria bacterium]